EVAKLSNVKLCTPTFSPFFVIHSDSSIPWRLGRVRFQLPLVQDKIGLKELVASLDIHPSHARLEMCVDPGSYPASLDMYRVLRESGHLNLPPIMWCRGGGRSPSVKLQSYAYGIKTWEDNYNIDYGFGAISYHMGPHLPHHPWSF
ncbi:hypothetical protein L9F63_018044, partial [Diploptera punctata]